VGGVWVWVGPSPDASFRSYFGLLSSFEVLE